MTASPPKSTDDQSNLAAINPITATSNSTNDIASSTDSFGVAEPAKPASPAPLPKPGTSQSPAFDPGSLKVNGDVNVIPREEVGFGQLVESANDLPADQSTGDEESSQAQKAQSQSLGLVQTTAPIAQDKSSLDETGGAEASSTDDLHQGEGQTKPVNENNSNKSAKSDKSPLEVLEEILAKTGEKQREEKQVDKQKQREKLEVEQAAKEAQYRQQAQQEITQKQADLTEVAQQQVETQTKLKQEGKLPDNLTAPADDQLVIHQLEHDTTTQ